MIKQNKNFYILTLGCQMNRSDAEKIRGILNNAGMIETEDEKKSDIIVVVACSVRQAAIDRIYGKSRRWQSKRNKGILKTVLTGCVLDFDKKKMADKFDYILPIADIGKLNEYFGGGIAVNDYLRLPAERDSKFQAYVPIMTGCNNFCAYCVVPYVRGREVSRPADEIIKECKKLIAGGYKEITLLGQNVNSYKSGKYNFPKLLSKIDGIKGDWWLRFLTSHPKDLSDDLLEIMARGEHITPYLHLAVQSGDKDVLKAMNRRYTPNDYMKIIKKAKRLMPGIMLSTDIIVGFPGESRKQFSNTVKLMEMANFDMAYMAQYSPRAGTVAAKMNDNVSRDEKKRRWEKLNNVLKKTALANNKKLIGKKLKILVESCEDGKCMGKTADFRMAIFPADNNLIGKFVDVNINQADSWGLKGKIYEEK